MNERAPAIEVCGLAKSFGDNRVLTGVDLAVTEGTIFALLGSNGGQVPGGGVALRSPR